jgi:hydrogenase-4 membrane subunit HyfE
VSIPDVTTVVTDSVVVSAPLTALYNAYTHRLQGKITSYRIQLLALAALAVAYAIQPTGGRPYYVIVAIALLIISTIIKQVMIISATSIPGSLREWLPFSQKARERHERAQAAWHEHSANDRHGRQIASLFTNGFIIAVAYFLARELNLSTSTAYPGSTPSVATSLALLLIGLVIMMTVPDILAQVMGLLVMENGLFLFVITIMNTNPGLRLPLVLSMLAWHTLTFIILLYILPRLQRASGSIEVDKQNELQE